MSDFKLPDYLTGNLTEVVVGDYVSSAGLSFKVTGFPSDELIEIVPSVDVGGRSYDCSANSPDRQRCNPRWVHW